MCAVNNASTSLKSQIQLSLHGDCVKILTCGIAIAIQSFNLYCSITVTLLNMSISFKTIRSPPFLLKEQCHEL